MTKDEYERYEQSVKTLNDHLCEIDYAAKKGMAEGMEKGILKGQRQEKLLMARNMIAKDLSTDFIMEITGLSEEEICKLNQA